MTDAARTLPERGHDDPSSRRLADRLRAYLDYMMGGSVLLSRHGLFLESAEVLRLRNMTALDATGIHALEQFSERLHKTGKTLLLCGARNQPSQLISRSDFLKRVGPENVLPNIQAALARVNEIQGDFEGIGRELALEMEHRPL